MASSSRNLLARKQRTTLRDDGRSKLIDDLRDGPKTRFTKEGGYAATRDPASSRWKMAFQIGQGGKPSDKPIIGKLFRGMYDNELTLPDEYMWQPVRPIGNGSYGAAALFKHENEDGNIDDYVVVKYTQFRTKEMVPRWNSDINQEAAVMMQLNELDNDGILFLREFRYFPEIGSHVSFTEYCPNFDVEMLRLTHRAMKRNIPDALLWYLLYTLAKGLVAMESGPFGRYATPHTHVPGAFLLHRDIKPANTFLGYHAAPSQPLTDNDTGYVGYQMGYPLAKIADFGLSQVTTLGDSINKARNHGAGTAYWHPPEVRIKQFGTASDWYPFRATRYDANGVQIPLDQPVLNRGNHALTPASNVFVIGYMMYQLITLDEPEDMHFYLDNIVGEEFSPAPDNILDPGDRIRHPEVLDEIEFEVRTGCLLDTDQKVLQHGIYGVQDMLARWKAAKADGTLKQIVENCMQFLPEKRPSAADLLALLEGVMPFHLTTLQQMQVDDPQALEQATRAFTCQADLPNMPPGDADVVRDRRFWNRVVRGFKWFDLTDGNMRPPMDDNDENIPEEARDLFYPGRKEGRNRVVGQPVRMSLWQKRNAPPRPRMGQDDDENDGDYGLGFGTEPLDLNAGRKFARQKAKYPY